jgi:hypothetical protein
MGGANLGLVFDPHFMRIIRFFSSTLIFIVFLLVIGIFLGRELLLIVATNDLKRSANRLLSINHTFNCREGFARSRSAWGQIRFIDDTNYVLETVCSEYQRDPIELESKTLPFSVRKIAGSSGFVFNLAEKKSSKITLHCLGKETVLFKEINELGVGEAPQSINYIAGPPTECAGFNYQCCLEDIEKGIGQVQQLATDCPRNCYASCQSRPFVVTFNGMPASLAGSRTISVTSGQEVTFAFVLSEGKKELFEGQLLVDGHKDESFLQWKSRLKIVTDFLLNQQSKSISTVQLPITSTIYFGDGQSYTTQDLQGVINHVYTCNEAVCNYEAWIEARDANLTASADHSATRLNIIVSN